MKQYLKVTPRKNIWNITFGILALYYTPVRLENSALILQQGGNVVLVLLYISMLVLS